MSPLLFISILTLNVHRSHERSTLGDKEYVAAVLEYHPVKDTNLNINAYIHFIEDAANKQADIIVFPEATLNHNHYIPVPVLPGSTTQVAPCYDNLNFHPILVNISCAAIANQIYVLINLSEVLNCTKPQIELCPQSKNYQFNTNVVFDRKGRIIDKYRKIHPYLEPNTSASLDNRLGVFDTDFGVKFGHFICFDILFQDPPLLLSQELGLKNLIMSTMWFSQAPMLVATQIQEGFARALDVNLLAANANNVNLGCSGSGIYSGKAGTLVSFMSVQNESRLIVFPVPKTLVGSSRIPKGPLPLSGKLHDSLFLSSSPDLYTYNTMLVPEVEMEAQLLKISQGNVFCQLHIRLQRSLDTVHYKYRIFARDAGVNLAGNIMSIAECGLMACLNDTLQSCGKRFNTEVSAGTYNFINLTIYAEVQDSIKDKRIDNIIFYPLSLTTDLQSLPSQNVHFSRRPALWKPNSQKITMSLIKPRTAILSFGLWGRIFDRDIIQVPN